MSNRDDFNGRSLPCLASNKVSGGIFVCRADAPYGSHPSGRAVAASPVKRYLRWAKYRLPFSVRESRLGLGERGGTEPLPTAAAVSCRSAHSLRCLYSTSIARTTDQSALTDGLRRAGSGQRFRPREAKSPIAISESADEPHTLQGTEVSPMDTLFFAFYPWKECCSPKAVSVVMSAGLQTSLLTPLSPSTQGRAEVRVIEPLSVSRQDFRTGSTPIRSMTLPVTEIR